MMTFIFIIYIINLVYNGSVFCSEFYAIILITAFKKSNQTTLFNQFMIRANNDILATHSRLTMRNPKVCLFQFRKSKVLNVVLIIIKMHDIMI